MFWLFRTHNAVVIAITVAVAVSFGQGIMFGPEATWVAELFAARLRYSGASAPDSRSARPSAAG